MRESWFDARKRICAGRVLIDKNFCLPDGTIKPKWLIILSDYLFSNNYVYCITTTKTTTYKKSYANYIKTNHPSLGGKEVIIEAQLIDLISVNTLKNKYNNGDLLIKSIIPSDLLNKIFCIIQDSERIEKYKKEWLGL